jgi:hypothetical protein
VAGGGSEYVSVCESSRARRGHSTAAATEERPPPYFCSTLHSSPADLLLHDEDERVFILGLHRLLVCVGQQ